MRRKCWKPLRTGQFECFSPRSGENSSGASAHKRGENGCLALSPLVVDHDATLGFRPGAESSTGQPGESGAQLMACGACHGLRERWESIIFSFPILCPGRRRLSPLRAGHLNIFFSSESKQTARHVLATKMKVRVTFTRALADFHCNPSHFFLFVEMNPLDDLMVIRCSQQQIRLFNDDITLLICINLHKFA